MNDLTTLVEDKLEVITLDYLESLGDIEMLTNLVPDGMLTCIHSVGGQGKSTLIAAHVDTILKSNNSIKEAIWLDYDAAVRRNTTLFKTLLTEHKENIKVVPVYTENSMNKLDTYLSKKDLHSTVIVVDALQGMCNRMSADINKATDMGTVMDKLRGYCDNGATVIVIHHSNKQDKEGWSNFRGSAVIQDSVDNLYQLRQVKRTNNKLTVEVDISPKFSFSLDESGDIIKEYTIAKDLSYNGSYKPCKWTDNQIQLAKAIVTNSEMTSLLKAEIEVKSKLKFGLNKTKELIKYMLETKIIDKVKVDTNRYIYILPGEIA